MAMASTTMRSVAITATAVAVLIGLGALPFAGQNGTPKANVLGDCRNASQTYFSTIFFVHDQFNKPVAGVNVTVVGFSQFTNSSGVVIFGGGNFTSFSFSYAHEALHESLAGYLSPLICAGQSYYRPVWLNLTE